MFYILITILLIIADQLSKYFTVANLSEFQSIKVIDKVLSFSHIHNTGGPWSLFSGHPIVFIIMTIIIFIFAIVYFKKNPPKHIIQKISVCLIAGGAIGNLIDRVIRGYVVDMIDIKFIDYPVFNAADCFIVTGVILFCVYIIFLDKESENKNECN